jgi:hypothetical protein
MKLFGCVLLSTLLVVVTTGTSRADGRTGSDTRGRAVQLGAAPVIFFSPNDFCDRDLDVVSCQTGMAALGFQGEVQYRFPFAWFALGLVGGGAFELNGAETCSSDGGCTPVEKTHLWRAALEVRFYPVIHRRVELWLAVEGGVAGAAGAAIPDVGAETGLGLGLDFPIGPHVSLGFDIRALFLGFGPSPDTPPDKGAVQMTNTFWTSVGLIKIGGRFSL